MRPCIIHCEPDHGAQRGPSNYCRECHSWVRAKYYWNHRGVAMHGLAIVCTLGLWLPIWVLWALLRHKWVCPNCGVYV